MALAAIVVMAAGCSKSNFIIGKWKLAPDAGPACAALDGVEFTSNTMIMNVLGKQTATVTYTRDGDNWTVNSPTGPITFQQDGDGIKSVSPFDCQLVAAN